MPKTKGEKVRRAPLKLSDDRNGSTFVKGLREIQVMIFWSTMIIVMMVIMVIMMLQVMTADEAYQALMIGRENLHFAATRLNHNSSRSHCIFTIKVHP